MVCKRPIVAKIGCQSNKNVQTKTTLIKTEKPIPKTEIYIDEYYKKMLDRNNITSSDSQTKNLLIDALLHHKAMSLHPRLVTVDARTIPLFNSKRSIKTVENIAREIMIDGA